MTPPDNIWTFSHPPLSTPKGIIARRKRGRPCSTNAARERSRVRTLRLAFLELQNSLPSVPRDTKLSKLDVLVLATTYISHLLQTLDDSHREEMKQQDGSSNRAKELLTETASNNDTTNNPIFKKDSLFRPVKKWPMRSRLYASIFACTDTMTSNNNGNRISPQKSAADITTFQRNCT